MGQLGVVFVLVVLVAAVLVVGQAKPITPRCFTLHSERKRFIIIFENFLRVTFCRSFLNILGKLEPCKKVHMSNILQRERERRQWAVYYTSPQSFFY